MTLCAQPIFRVIMEGDSESPPTIGYYDRLDDAKKMATAARTVPIRVAVYEGSVEQWKQLQ